MDGNRNRGCPAPYILCKGRVLAPNAPPRVKKNLTESCFDWRESFRCAKTHCISRSTELGAIGVHFRGGQS
jgi:hypothetical protein